METPEPWIRTIRKKYQFININGYTTFMGDNFEVEIYEADKKLNFKIDLSKNLSRRKKRIQIFYYDAERLIRNKESVKSIVISDEESITTISNILSNRPVDDNYTFSLELTLKETILTYDKVEIKTAEIRQLEFIIS